MDICNTVSWLISPGFWVGVLKKKNNMPQSIKNKTKEGVEVEIIISDNSISAGFRIGSPTDLEIILTDKNNDLYQADVFLNTGWTNKDLQEIITQTILNCDAKIKEIKATIKGIVSQN